MASNLPFIDPTANRGQAKVLLAPRPFDLDGKVLGLLDNSKEQADIILETIAGVLRERHGVAGVVVRRKPAFSIVATEEVLNEMAREVDVAIAALGG